MYEVVTLSGDVSCCTQPPPELSARVAHLVPQERRHLLLVRAEAWRQRSAQRGERPPAGDEGHRGPGSVGAEASLE